MKLLDKFQRIHSRDYDYINNYNPNNLDQFNNNDWLTIMKHFPNLDKGQSLCQVNYYCKHKGLFKQAVLIRIIISKYKDEWYHVSVEKRSEKIIYFIDQRDELSELLTILKSIIDDHKQWWSEEVNKFRIEEIDFDTGPG